MLSPPIFADNRDVDHDPQADFSKFKTFTLREGTIAVKAPDLNSPLVRKKIDEAIRTQLAAKGLREVQNQAELASHATSFGAVFIAMMKAIRRHFLEKLPNDIKKLFSEYPPKKK